MDVDEYSNSTRLWSIILNGLLFLLIWVAAAPPANASVRKQFTVGVLSSGFGLILLGVWNFAETLREFWNYFLEFASHRIRLSALIRFYDFQAAALGPELVDLAAAFGFILLSPGLGG